MVRCYCSVTHDAVGCSVVLALRKLTIEEPSRDHLAFCCFRKLCETVRVREVFLLKWLLDFKTDLELPGEAICVSDELRPYDDSSCCEN